MRLNLLLNPSLLTIHKHGLKLALYSKTSEAATLSLHNLTFSQQIENVS